MERQLNASMHTLISMTDESKLSIYRGPLLEEYRRQLLSAAYIIAADSHSLYTVVCNSRKKNCQT